jgi:membrane protease YdiL (CAAX protease family)
MNSLPEHEPDNDPRAPEDSGIELEEHVSAIAPTEPCKPDTDAPLAPLAVFDYRPVETDDAAENAAGTAQRQGEPPSEPLLFQSWYQPEVRPPTRIPHFGHVAILATFAFFGLLCVSLLIRVALHFQLFGIATAQKAVTDVHYTLGSEAVLYLITFVTCVLFFPMIWHKGFFAGIQWNGATALHLRQRLFLTASICFALALINGLLLPSPTNAPIDKIFRSPGAAWLLFGFGVTFAPFFEEMVFRGFLLPAFCTACDWVNEKARHAPVRPLDANGQPQWSMTAMVLASVLVSLPFAGMHAAQTGYSWGPFVLLVGVSLVLCWARLSTRSLAASVMVHASYNFLLFSLMLLGTEGFRHLERM